MNIKPIAQKQAQKLWRCGVPLLWMHVYDNPPRWEKLENYHASPVTHARGYGFVKFGVEVE